MSEEAPAEDVVAKYKRLLSLARSSLEANQATIAAKDQYIANLLTALEEEKAKAAKKHAPKDDEASHLPRRILCRVDVEDLVWILIEYDDSDDQWKFFTDEQSMFDYLQRIPGVPLVCPPKCLSAQESHLIEEQSKSRVERIVEEFRRYKVRTEIARKQKDAENKQALLNGSNGPTSASGAGLSGTLEKALTNGAVNTDLAQDETKRLKQMLEDQEAKWRSAYEKIARENEILRNKGGESVLATQWRNRYETCLKERDELSDKLKKFTKLNDELGVNGVPVEQAYLDLQDEFRDFRRKIAAIEKRRKQETAHNHHSSSSSNSSGGSSAEGGAGADSDISALIADYELEDSIERHHQESVSTSRKSLTHAGASSSGGGGNGSSNSDVGGGAGGGAGSISGGLTEAKIQYIRSMIVQYLACKEPEVKAHMENALIVLFRMTPAEREAIEERRKEESQDTLTSLTSFLGGLSS